MVGGVWEYLDPKRRQSPQLLSANAEWYLSVVTLICRQLTLRHRSICRVGWGVDSAENRVLRAAVQLDAWHVPSLLPLGLYG